jgi:DNA-binding transcriptional LysR family regulator
VLSILSELHRTRDSVRLHAVSAQVARLEEDLGVRLFERRPFRLTPAGKALYDFIAPFFSRLGEVEDIVKAS